MFCFVVSLLWPPCIADMDIIFYRCGFFFLLFFLAYSKQSEIGCLPYFHSWCGLSANLECRSELCCTRLAENTGHKNYAKNHHLCTITQRCWAISLQPRHVSTIEKKLVKQQYLLHMSWQYGELPTNGWDWLASLGHRSKFQGVSSLGFVTAPTSLNRGQPNFARCLAVTWVRSLYTHFWGLLPPNGILPCAKFTLHPSIAFCCIGSVTARHVSSVR